MGNGGKVMKTSTVAVGVILLVAGLLLFFAGQGIRDNAQRNYLLSGFGLFGDSSSYESAMAFGGGLMFISVIMIICSFIVMLVGATKKPNSVETKEKESKKVFEKISEDKPIKKEINEKFSKYCFECGEKLEGDPKFCNQCGTKLR